MFALRYPLILLLWFIPCAMVSAVEVLPGIEVLCRSRAAELQGKRVGLVTNPTGIDLEGVSTIDRIKALPGVELNVLFAPEHGLRGGEAAGASIDDSIDSITKLPIVSLHGASKSPPAGQIQQLDAVLYDIQDITSRSYTFISTMVNVMKVCAAQGVEFWVLDRPDPLGGDKIGGPSLDQDLRSFIGIYNVPQVYGLTPGEFATLYKAEALPDLKLTVVPLKGWRRGMTYGDLGWDWIPPSPHIPRWESCYFYAMTGTFGELGLVSEGVGTPLPFEQFGAPWMNGPKMADRLNALGLAGVRFRATSFKPRYGTFTNKMCSGVQIHLHDAHACNPAQVSTAILKALAVEYKSKSIFNPTDNSGYEMFLKALGDRQFAKALTLGAHFEEAEPGIEADRQSFLKRRAGILIYE